MTVVEFRKLVGQSPNKDFLSSLEIVFSFNKIGEVQQFSSIIDFYNFVCYQFDNWQKFSNLPQEITGIRSYEEVKVFLEKQVESYFEGVKETTTLNAWKDSNLKNEINKIIINCSDYYDSRSKFIATLSEEFDTETAVGAYKFFMESQSLANYQPKQIKGLLMAYEFSVKEKSSIFSRTKIEFASLRKLEKTYQKVASELNSQHVNHISESAKSYRETVGELEKFKIAKEEQFLNWFTVSQNKFNEFDGGASKRIEELEEVYEKKLQLEKPAKYWDKKSKEYYRQATLMRNIVSTVIAIFGGFLMAILVISPERIFISLEEPGNQSIFIRWSVIFVLLVSLVVFIIRALTKVMFSSYHLARDAEEKHTLTFFYLALINGNKSEIKDQDRKMIIQSLFSRSDTGLLKGDSSPEMPNDFLSKILPKG